MSVRQGAVLVGLLVWAGHAVAAEPLPADHPQARQQAEELAKLPPLLPQPAGHLDVSGRNVAGKASYYAPFFTNRTMADGRRMNPNTNIAASKTLPLGTVAAVTNLDNGKTATVRIEDRGPYVNGRVVDLAPKVARNLHMTGKGVVPVVVKPITIPKPDGLVALGAGAAEVSPQTVDDAIRTTETLTGDKPVEQTAAK